MHQLAMGVGSRDIFIFACRDPRTEAITHSISEIPGPCCIRLPYENSFWEGGRSTSCGRGTPLGLRGGPSEDGEMIRGSAAYAPPVRSMLVLGLREEE